MNSVLNGWIFLSFCIGAVVHTEVDHNRALTHQTKCLAHSLFSSFCCDRIYMEWSYTHEFVGATFNKKIQREQPMKMKVFRLLEKDSISNWWRRRCFELYCHGEVTFWTKSISFVFLTDRYRALSKCVFLNEFEISSISEICDNIRIASCINVQHKNESLKHARFSSLVENCSFDYASCNEATILCESFPYVFFSICSIIALHNIS